jgi:DNA adenine methylase
MAPVFARAGTPPVYRETCLGSGAVYFRLFARVRPAVLADINAEVIDFYRCVRDHVEELLVELRTQAEAFEQAFAEDPVGLGAFDALYYALRGDTLPLETLGAMPLVKRAARTLVLNKLGINGLYRLNRTGRFNVPVGRRATGADGTRAMPSIFVARAVRAASRALQGAELLVLDAVEHLARARRRELVYVDPPYVPLKKGGFTLYTGHDFTEADQARLAKACHQAVARGVLVATSNHDVPVVRRLYKGMHMRRIMVTRSIAAKASARGKVAELLITNF